MHSYCSDNAVTLLNAEESLKIRSTMNFKNSKLKYSHFVCWPAGQPACLPAIRPGSASAMALEFLHNKGNCVGFTKLLF